MLGAEWTSDVNLVLGKFVFHLIMKFVLLLLLFLFGPRFFLHAVLNFCLLFCCCCRYFYFVFYVVPLTHCIRTLKQVFRKIKRWNSKYLPFAFFLSFSLSIALRCVYFRWIAELSGTMNVCSFIRNTEAQPYQVAGFGNVSSHKLVQEVELNGFSRFFLNF